MKGNTILKSSIYIFLLFFLINPFMVRGQEIDTSKILIENNDTFKFENKSISIDSLKCLDSAAYNFFKKNLEEIYNWIYNKKPSNIYFSINAIENITGIISNSNGDYLGKNDPSIEEYEAWKMWLEINKFNLCWDKVNQSMKLCIPPK